MMNLKFFDAVFLSVRLITATAITAFLLSIPPRLTTGVMTYVFHTRCGCIPCGLSILLSPPRRAGRKGVGCSHRQCYRLFNACSTGPTHQTCLTAYRRVGDLRSIHRVPNLTDNGVLMVYLLARSSVALRLINQTFVYERNRSVGTGKRIVPFTSPD